MELPCKYNSGLDDTFLEVVENNDHDLNFLVIRRARRESEQGLSVVLSTEDEEKLYWFLRRRFNDRQFSSQAAHYGH